MFGKKERSNCGFAGESVVDYIFGEMSVDRVAAFESHLADCDACISELAAISEARFEVYEWRKLAFDPLATPVVRIPYGEAVSVAFGTRISQFFTGVRVWAVGGLAAACFALGALVAFNGTSGRGVGGEVADIAGGSAGQLEVVSTSSPAPVAVTPAEVKQQVVPLQDVASRKSVLTRLTGVKARPTVASSVRPSGTQVAIRRSTGRTNTRDAVPTLSGYAAEEDSSLRLADVFEDIGGSIR